MDLPSLRRRMPISPNGQATTVSPNTIHAFIDHSPCNFQISASITRFTLLLDKTEPTPLE